MNKKRSLIIYSIITFIFGMLYFIFQNKINQKLGIDNLRALASVSRSAPLIFIGLWSIRLLVVIPGVTLMVLGGLLFSPFTAFCLSIVGLVISDSIVFLIGRGNLFSNLKNKVNDKHNKMITLIKKYDYKFLAIGILCPIAPTDVVCYLSSCLGMSYFKYVATLIIANIPALFLYSCLGKSFEDSIYNAVFIVVTLIITGLLSLRVWNKLKE